MAHDSLLEQFHSDMRVNYTADPGYEILREPLTLRIVSTNKKNTSNMVLYSNLDESNADSVIEREISFFRERNEPFEWKLFDYDKPRDLAERLAIHGFKEGEEESLLVISLENFPQQASTPPPQATIAKIEAETELRTFLETVSGDETNPEHVEALLQNLLAHLREAPDTIGIFGAYWDNKPAAMGWAFYSPGSRFSGFFGGTTVSEYRGKGLYKALVRVRAEEARKRNYAYGFVDAGPMSQPILKKLGFTEVTGMRGFHWSPY